MVLCIDDEDNGTCCSVKPVWSSLCEASMNLAVCEDKDAAS